MANQEGFYGAYAIKTKEGEVGALSYLPAEDTFQKGKGLRSEAVIGTIPGDAASISQENFTPNTKFVSFMQDVIAKHGPALPGFEEEARRIEDGSMGIIDGRVNDPGGVVETEDILGVFEVKGGKAIRYHANDKHLLVSKRGIFRLDPWLHQRLIEEARSLG